MKLSKPVYRLIVRAPGDERVLMTADFENDPMVSKGDTIEILHGDLRFNHRVERVHREFQAKRWDDEQDVPYVMVQVRAVDILAELTRGG